ncbi:MAG TPA: hypothetical protein VGP63_30315 [Planctomycetaceae bacterium]|jgi:very-short-patch-repair endonuclease|nr:hypothetical protein [Planctomycetaceae bacterium]
MTGLERIIELIAGTLAGSVKAHSLPAVASSLGLEPGEVSEAFGGKQAYVTRRITGWSKDRLLDLANRINEIYPTDSLQTAIEAFDPNPAFPISPITRQHLLSCFDELSPVQGKLGIVEFTEKLWPIRTMAGGGYNHRCPTAYDEICQHMIKNDDYSFSDLIDVLGLREMSNRKLVELLELSVNPLVRVDAEQQQFVAAFNAHLKHDGLALVASDQISGFPVFRMVSAREGVSGAAKNLVFASDGPKPEIVLSDAINNDIKIVKHEEHCLVYDRPLTNEGLSWRNLSRWWAETTAKPDNKDTERDLYGRLLKCLSSPAEALLFRTYFKAFHTPLGDRLPALLPQVYLHYDPYTVAQRRGRRVLPRQRMDFLLLLSSFERIVVEVDGKHHYSDENVAAPDKYAEMVHADRELRLLGYEVYRFGGSELTDERGEAAVTAFFNALFQKHEIRVGTKSMSDEHA